MKSDDKTTLEQVAIKINNSMGNNTITNGGVTLSNPQRLPFGIFPVDFATGGGIPLYSSTCLWGRKASGKTTLAIRAMKSAQEICWGCFNHLERCTCSTPSLKMKSLWCDAEGTLESSWVKAHGVEDTSFLLALCDYGEQYIDVACSALQSDDCGLVIIDSLAALTPLAEIENPTEKTNMGKHPAMVTRAVRKLKQRLIRERKKGHPCAVLFINQMRADPNIQYGSSDSMPGGHGSIHEYSLVLKCTKKSLSKDKDKKFIDEDRNLNLASRHLIRIPFSKTFILRGSAEYVLISEPIPDYNLYKGEIDDYATTIKYAQNYEIITKTGNSTYEYAGEKWASLKSIIEFFKEYKVEYFYLIRNIIQKARNNILNIKREVK